MKACRAALMSLVILGQLEADEEKPATSTLRPWFTGTLLAPINISIPPGYVDIEPLFSVLNQSEVYDAEWDPHSVPNFLSASPLLFFTVGIVDGLNFALFPSASYNRTQGKSSTRFDDFEMGFDWQIYFQKEDSWWPGVLIGLFEVFPTGKYQKLNPKKKETDLSGLGAWTTIPSIVFSRQFIHIRKQQYLNLFLTFEYLIPTNVHVKGFNAYGGGFGTRGKVHTGAGYTALFSFEYSLTQNWVLAFDFVYGYRNRRRFSGRKGHLANGTVAPVGTPSANQISLAPAIEYNFSEVFGIIGGPWFTVAGRNAAQFAGAVIAFNWYFNTKTSKKMSIPAR